MRRSRSGPDAVARSRAIHDGTAHREERIACWRSSAAGDAGGFIFLTMTKPACPACTLEDVLMHPDHWECATCGHEWPKEETPEGPRVVKDAHGNVLVDGDTVTLIKDLKLRGGSTQRRHEGAEHSSGGWRSRNRL